MARFNSLWTFLLLAFVCVTLVFAQETEEENYANVNVEVTADFPDSPLGFVTNGQRNKVILTVANKEDYDFSVLAVSGRVTDTEEPEKIVRNLTALRYDLTVPAEKTVEIPYLFYSEFAPGDYGLTIFIDVLGNEKLLRIVGYNGVVTITDPETPWYDPQLLFLYAVLGAIALGIGYVIREAFFGGSSSAKAKKVSKEPAAKPTHRDEKGQMILDESWIPEHHLKSSSPKQSPKVKKRSSRK